MERQNEERCVSWLSCNIMQTEISQQRNSAEREEREKEKERRRASRQWWAVAGRLTAPKELVSCIWRRALQIIWGGCQTYLESNAQESPTSYPSSLYLLMFPLSLSLSYPSLFLFLGTLRTVPEHRGASLPLLLSSVLSLSLICSCHFLTQYRKSRKIKGCRRLS